MKEWYRLLMKNQEDIARLITLEAVSFKLNNFTAFHGINFSHSKAAVACGCIEQIDL
jgi:hypothetical protein